MKTKIILAFIFSVLAGGLYWYYDVSRYMIPSHIETTAWAKQHVQQQLSTITKPVTINDIERTYTYLKEKMPQKAVVHVSIRGGIVTFKLPDENLKKITYTKVMKYVLKQLGKQNKLNDNDVLIVLHDVSHDVSLPAELSHVPLFVFAKDTAHNDNLTRLLIVDSFTLKSWGEIYRDIKKGHTKYPWNKKENKLFWRGKTTDSPDDLNLRMNSPRITLAKLSKQFPERYDARLTKILSQDPKQISDIKKACGDIVPFASIIDHMSAKYQITLDGLTATFPGFLWRMASGSVNIKQESTNVQWFYDLFKPHVHYIPVARDLSNIDAVMTYAISADAEMESMAQRAQQVIERELTPPKVLGYFVELLNAYSVHVQQKIILVSPITSVSK